MRHLLTLANHPESDPTYIVNPGTNRGTAISEAISAASARYTSTGRVQDVLLRVGAYYLEQAIVGKSGVRLIGAGPNTVLIGDFDGDDDTASNALVIIEGALDATKLNTTLSAEAPADSTSIAVAAAGTIAAGDHVLVQGWNDPSDDAPNHSDGPDVILSEVCRVGSSYASGLTLPLAWATLQHHAPSTSVKAVTPVVGFELRDVRLAGSEDGVTTACGVYALYSRDITISGVSGSGFSRALVELKGVNGFRVDDLRSLGTNNCWLHLISCQAGEVSRVRGTPGATRNHSEGVPRFPLYHRFRCTSVDFRDIVIEGTSLGIFSSGGHHIRFSDVTVRDVELTTTVYAALVAGGEWHDSATARIPVGWGAGFPVIETFAEWAHDVQVSNLRTENLRAPTTGNWGDAPFRAMAVYFSDVRELLAVNVSCVNRGKLFNVMGVVTTDMVGEITNLSVTGHSYGFMTQNDQNVLRVNNYYFDGVVAAGGVSNFATVGIYFDHRSPDHIRFNGVRIVNSFGYIRFGSEFMGNAANDPRLTIENLYTDDGEWSYVVVAENPSATQFATAEVVEIDPTYTGAHLRVRAPDTGSANYQRRLAAVAIGRPYDIGHASPIMIAPLPQRRATLKATDAAIAYGDTLVLSGTRSVAADNTLDGSPRLGTAISYKAAGASGNIIAGIAA